MPKTLTPKLALAAVLALAFSGLAISAAPAKNTVEINSRIILRSNTPAFHGKVKSPKEACLDNRLVKLFKKKSNAGDRKLLGKTHTNENGKWDWAQQRPNRPPPRSSSAGSAQAPTGRWSTSAKRGPRGRPSPACATSPRLRGSD